MSLINGVWHDAKIDLPKSGEQVLCIKRTKNGVMSFCFGYHTDDRTYDNGWVVSGMCNNVLYWMPLPKIPEEDPRR